MKVTLNWLRQYVDFDGSTESLADLLTMLGMEVEGVRPVPGDYEGIVVAEVLSRDPVPGSDKLSVCRVQDGKGERRIICGASNFSPGDKVPLILPGFSLPLQPGQAEPFVIKERKVFGIVSQGMMCSPEELGLPDQVDGLLILRPEARVGQSFAEYLGRPSGDVVFDLEVTPNRPDLNSVIGIAREIAAATRQPLKLPEIPEPAERGEASPNQPSVTVRIDEPELCPRYIARTLLGVTVAPSPDWLRQLLEKVGIRSINNVVDVTNYVMMETGQPLHAFDYHLLARDPQGRPEIIIRSARPGEKFTTLDGQERTLTTEMLLIADEQKAVALAGIMGGQNSEITNQTTDVLLESAYFKSGNIRRTSKTLGLRSESSYRFERGADIAMAEWASRRAAQLILATAGGQPGSLVVDAYPKPFEPRTVSLRFAKTDALLGISIPPEQQSEFLERLSLARQAGSARPDTAAFEIPSFRVDLKRETDLIEEVARLYGVDRIPATAPRGAIGSNAFDGIHDQLHHARSLLAGLGLNESQGQTLVPEAAAVLVAPQDHLVRLTNPLSSDMNVLRPSLLPGLLDALRHNLHHKTGDVALFEVGRAFSMVNGRPSEGRRLAMVLTGRRSPFFWSGEGREARADIYDLKGIIEEFLEQFGVRGVSWARGPEGTGFYLESSTIQLGSKVSLGEFGQLLPAVARRYDLRDPVLLAELNLDSLLARRKPARSFKPLPQYPAIRRDVAMIVPETVTHEAVLNAVRQSKPAHLEGIELFDIFRGQHIPEGQKSMAYAFTYRHGERTLTDSEVNAAHASVVAQFKQVLQAVVRDS